MNNSELVENVDKLFKQSETGNVDSQVALKVFTDAYEAIPRGGYIASRRSYASFQDGSRSWHSADISASGETLRSQTRNDEKGFPVCADQKGYFAEQCMQKVYGKPVTEDEETKFQSGLSKEVKVARYSRLGMSQEDRHTYWKYEVDGLKLERKEINHRMDLTISRKMEDGSTQHLSFFKPNTIYSAPARFSGMRVSDPSGEVIMRRPSGKFIGMHGYDK